MTQYEAAILYHPSLEVGLSKAEEQILKIFKNNQVKVIKTDNWGKRKLAYPISKQEFAIYVFYTVEMPPESVQKVEATLNITDEILRYLITKPDLKAAQAAEELKTKIAKSGNKTEEVEEEDNVEAE